MINNALYPAFEKWNLLSDVFFEIVNGGQDNALTMTRFIKGLEMQNNN